MGTRLAYAVSKGFPLVTNLVMLRQGESRRGFKIALSSSVSQVRTVAQKCLPVRS